MTVRIRLKLALLLIAVAVVPLALALTTMIWGGRELRAEAIGHERHSVAYAQAMGLKISLVKDIQKLGLALEADSTVTAFLEAPRERMSEDALWHLDAAWGSLPDDAPEMRKVLRNSIADRLRAFQLNDHRLVEILVADSNGELVAATGRTEDYDQSDEEWWQLSYADGKGTICVPKIHEDPSAGVWSVDLCIPIVSDKRVLGVAKAVVDVSQWFRGTEAIIGMHDAVGRLVAADGTIIYPRPASGEPTTLDDWRGDITQMGKPGWRLTQGKIQAYAPVILPGRIGMMPVHQGSQWLVVLEAPEVALLAETRSLTWWMLATGMVVIAVIFLGGLYVVDRSVAARIRRLTSVARDVAHGDLSRRVDVEHWTHLMGRDELDDLAEQFNHMVDQVEGSHRDLEDANDLKAKFIKVAGHELRTPISYILTLPKLMADVDDIDKLRHGYVAMEGKARRLNEIIQAIFKLMPGQGYSQYLRLEDVDLPKLLENVYRDVLPFVEERHQILVIEAKKDLPLIRMDHYKIRDVLENLLGNAIKFTPDGGAIHVTATKQLGDRITISVLDQGPGIPSEDMKNIFNPFFSTMDVMKHSSGAIGYQKRGMGLGLAVVKHFTEMHGGSVHVTTSSDGSTFAVTLPVGGPEQTATEQ